ncbi:DnaJ-domain-containing protein [Thozetella sp. PMI_491]|nr:DnaJ-domain-containing protein [Thozetella sp. PMI_491]
MVAEAILYDRLGLAYDASPADIKSSYRKAALRWHPDRNPDDPVAAERFKECLQSYEILSNPEKRVIYDSMGLEAALRPSHSYHTTHAQSEDVRTSESDDGQDGFQRPQTTTSNAGFRFQASWSFEFGGRRGHDRDPAFDAFWSRHGVATSDRGARLFDNVRAQLFTRVGSFWDDDDDFWTHRRSRRTR